MLCRVYESLKFVNICFVVLLFCILVRCLEGLVKIRWREGREEVDEGDWRKNKPLFILEWKTQVHTYISVRCRKLENKELSIVCSLLWLRSL